MVSSSSQQPFFPLLALLPIAIHGTDFITQKCGENFTGNAILQGNINSVLLDLVANTSAYGFANSQRGTGGADTIYGISECREGANAQACSACMAEAALKAHTSCPNSADLRVWQHSCYLRYANKNFIGQPDSTKVGAWYSANKPADQQTFTQAVELLGVVGTAAAHGENRKFGWGVMESPNSKGNVPKLYGMAQCTWDLNQAACIKCLSDAQQIRRESCGDRAGCYVITESCSIRHESNAFLFLNVPLDPATPARSINVGSL